MEETDLRHKVAEHDREIGALRTDIATMTSTVSHLDRTVQTGFSKLDIFMSKQNEAKTHTLDDLVKWLQVAALSAALIGGIVSGIVYIASNSNAVDVALIKYKMAQLYSSFGWEPTIERVPADHTKP